MDQHGLSERAAEVLAEHGWSSSYSAAERISEWVQQLGPGFSFSPAAADALARYGGITVRQSGPGIERGRDSFELDPTLALGEAELFREYGAIVGEDLFPIGEAANGRVFLAVASDGRVYALMGEELWRIGVNIDEALTKLVEGRRVELLT